MCKIIMCTQWKDYVLWCVLGYWACHALLSFFVGVRVYAVKSCNVTAEGVRVASVRVFSDAYSWCVASRPFPRS